MLDLRVNGALPGDTVSVSKGDKLRISAKAYGRDGYIPLNKLELIGHSRVLKSVSVADPGQSKDELTIDLDIPADRGLWIAARCKAGPQQMAHTTPVYISVDGGGFHNPDTVSANLDRCEAYLKEIEEEISERHERVDYNAWRYKDGLTMRISKTRRIIRELRTQLD